MSRLEKWCPTLYILCGVACMFNGNSLEGLIFLVLYELANIDNGLRYKDKE